jgi:hypothetical protein
MQKRLSRTTEGDEGQGKERAPMLDTIPWPWRDASDQSTKSFRLASTAGPVQQRRSLE